MSDQKLGIVIVSHVNHLAEGLETLVKAVAKDVPITVAGGLEDGSVGTSLEKIEAAIKDNAADELLAFYDLGSAKMNLEMALEMSDKKIHLYDASFVEGTYTAAALLQARTGLDAVEAQLKPLIVKE
ncbi:MAG: dihydroxyacetone kinase phosphoryl donor subunit DhaM [Bavariicoccus seileri]|uniref:dihydroxyacetone kinase phosphoryl donor subunit DhaM n=1 Tax=Bavariicoccus seileri TaxID=549685 RepID=UPI0003B43F4C|nr:dihydroxyacetone kinase phosphoryl donor subunit DhaM [Bavariicoccus seileri]